MILAFYACIAVIAHEGARLARMRLSRGNDDDTASDEADRRNKKESIISVVECQSWIIDRRLSLCV